MTANQDINAPELRTLASSDVHELRVYDRYRQCAIAGSCLSFVVDTTGRGLGRPSQYVAELCCGTVINKLYLWVRNRRWRVSLPTVDVYNN